ncbi:MAG TPA: hypothetical protein VNB94_12775, partial [Mycobacteriales bacterium]|nr:hypothetical protein [Mycobacteriales bacterium]
MAGRRRRLAPLAAAAALLLSGDLPSRAAVPAPRLSVSVDRPAFWTAGAPTCTDDGDPCWDFPLDVQSSPDAALRIGIDHVVVGDVFSVELVDPSGAVAGEFSPGTGLYSQELLLDDATPGEWRVHVVARSVTDRRFRMRATVQADVAAPRRRTLLAPNLQALPPHDISFLL